MFSDSENNVKIYEYSHRERLNSTYYSFIDPKS